MTGREGERIASLEAKVDTLVLDLNVIKTDVRTLLIRDIERAVVSRYVNRVSRLVPWAAIGAAVVALFK